jgi:hypothetical protein
MVMTEFFNALRIEWIIKIADRFGVFDKSSGEYVTAVPKFEDATRFRTLEKAWEATKKLNEYCILIYRVETKTAFYPVDDDEISKLKLKNPCGMSSA